MPASSNGVQYTLSLADGAPLALSAWDADSVRVLSFFAKAAMLQGMPGPHSRAECQRLVVTKDRHSMAHAPEALPGVHCVSICVLEPRDQRLPRKWHLEGDHAEEGSEKATDLSVQSLADEQWFWQQLLRLSACIGRETQFRGGVLLHSGLAAYSDDRSLTSSGATGAGSGILLAGRSGVGKSTALRRLPFPWLALADDVTLVARDGEGTYWAHPWPTWSRFFGEEAGDGSDTWDVQHAAPLQAIFFLEQGDKDRAEPLGAGQAVCLLAELGLQTSEHALRGMPLEEIAAFNLQRFENLCDLVQAVPAYLLDLSVNGAFWQEIERVTQCAEAGASA